MSREAFEKYANYHGFNTRLRNDPESSDTYFAYETEQRYKTWQACEAHMQAEIERLGLLTVQQLDVLNEELCVENEKLQSEIAKRDAVIAKKNEALKLAKVTFIANKMDVRNVMEVLDEALALTPENVRIEYAGTVNLIGQVVLTLDASQFIEVGTKLYAIVKDGE